MDGTVLTSFYEHQPITETKTNETLVEVDVRPQTAMINFRNISMEVDFPA